MHIAKLTLILILLSISSLINVGYAQGKDSTVFRMEVKFQSSKYEVNAWLFAPKNNDGKKMPAIVMAPGFSGIRECSYQFYAQKFAQAGFCVLLFDYPNFGVSDGPFRGEVDPNLQIQAYRDAISYCETSEIIDAKRIGIWGGSYSGGHIIVVSALDSRVKCMVSMTPFISGNYYKKQMNLNTLEQLNAMFNSDRLARSIGKEPATIPVVANDIENFAAISSRNAFKFQRSFKDYAPLYQNWVTLKSLELQIEYEPGSYVSQIRDIPKLFIYSQDDEMIPASQIKETFHNAPEPKKLIEIKGNHFSPYMEGLDEAARLAIDWFQKHL